MFTIWTERYLKMRREAMERIAVLSDALELCESIGIIHHFDALSNLVNAALGEIDKIEAKHNIIFGRHIDKGLEKLMYYSWI